MEKQNKINILIDLSFIRTGNHYAGVSKYAYRFLNYLIEVNEVENVTLLLNVLSEKQIRKWYPQFKCQTIGKLRYRKLKGIRTWNLTATFRKAVKNSGCNIVFCPYGSDINWVKIDVPKITVIHDIQLQIDAKGFQRWYHKIIDNFTVKHTDKIITISECAKKQIHSVYPQTEIVNFSNCVEITPCQTPPILSFPYILYVGRMCKMKGCNTLVKAFVQMASQKPEFKLVMIGYEEEYWHQVLEPVLRKAHLEERVITIKQCTESEIANYYAHAKLFVFPSLREGFGSPPVEAAMYKIPVISSMVDSLEEVSMGMFYTYGNATDDKSLADKIVEVLNTPPSKERLENISLTMAETYSIERVGEKILNLIYRTYNETINA